MRSPAIQASSTPNEKRKTPSLLTEHIQGVLRDAEYIYNNAIDVAIDMYGTKAAAATLYSLINERNYSTQVWGQHDLHPTIEEGFTEIEMVNFVFTMDLLNFS